MTPRQPTRAELVKAISSFLEHEASDDWSEIFFLIGVLDRVAESGDFRAMITTLQRRRSSVTAE